MQSSLLLDNYYKRKFVPQSSEKFSLIRAEMTSILILNLAGDTCLDALRIREAGTWYMKAIRKREVPWAVASLCFIDYMMTGHQDYVAELLNASRRSTYFIRTVVDRLTRVN